MSFLCETKHHTNMTHLPKFHFKRFLLFEHNIAFEIQEKHENEAKYGRLPAQVCFKQKLEKMKNR